MRTNTPPGEVNMAHFLSERVPEGKRRECSRMTGIPSATLTRKLMGRGDFTIAEIESIATYLGTRSEQLIAEARDAA